MSPPVSNAKPVLVPIGTRVRVKHGCTGDWWYGNVVQYGNHECVRYVIQLDSGGYIGSPVVEVVDVDNF